MIVAQIYFAGIDRHARSFSGSADAKGDFETESRAAVRRRDDDFDMPNTMLPTLTREALEKETLLQSRCAIRILHGRRRKFDEIRAAEMLRAKLYMAESTEICYEQP